jgi:hypothetical protein
MGRNKNHHSLTKGSTKWILKIQRGAMQMENKLWMWMKIYRSLIYKFITAR